MNFFEDDFDEQKWIHERLLEIKDLNERSAARKLAEQVLQPFYAEMQKEFRHLEDRLLLQNEREGHIPVMTSIAPKREVDLTDPFLHPMCAEDMKEQKIAVSEILGAVKQDAPCRLYTVYYEAPYREVQALLERDETFEAKLCTEYGVYPGMVRLCESRRYTDGLRQLYEVFVTNGLAWNTVNAPFIRRMLDVQMFDAQCPEDEELLKIEVDFREYQPKIKFDYIPLWNISTKYVKTSTYPQPHPSGVRFEHIVQGNKLAQNCEYLIQSHSRVWESARIHHAGQSLSVNGKDQNIPDLVILCDEKKPAVWKLWEIAPMPAEYRSSFPLKVSSTDPPAQPIRTQAQAIYYANQLKLDGIRLVWAGSERPEGFCRTPGYYMDDFLFEEIRNRENAPELYFVCETEDSGNLWSEDDLSYMLSTFQSIYPEYRCVGWLR